MEISYLAEQAVHSQRYWLLPLTACSLCLLIPVLRLTNLLCTLGFVKIYCVIVWGCWRM